MDMAPHLAAQTAAQIKGWIYRQILRVHHIFGAKQVRMALVTTTLSLRAVLPGQGALPGAVDSPRAAPPRLRCYYKLTHPIPQMTSTAGCFPTCNG